LYGDGYNISTGKETASLKRGLFYFIAAKDVFYVYKIYSNENKLDNCYYCYK